MARYGYGFAGEFVRIGLVNKEECWRRSVWGGMIGMDAGGLWECWILRLYWKVSLVTCSDFERMEWCVVSR